MADNDSLINASTEAEKLTGGVIDYLIINGAYSNAEENFLSPSEFTGKEELLTNSMIESLKVNVLGVVFSINAFLPLVRRSSIKKIIVISTGLSDRDTTEKSTISFFMTYSAIKAALNMVVAKYAVRFREQGVVFLAVSPGLVDTSTHAPTEEELAGILKMIESFKHAAPGWDGKPLTPEQSVSAMLKVIDGLTIKDSGAFLSQYGNKEWL